MGADSTKRRSAGGVTSERARGGLGRVGIGLTGVCFILGFSLTTLLTRVTHGAEQAAELVSAQALAADSDPIARASIQGFEFAPDRVKVSMGTIVLWTNRDGVDHDVTFLQGDLASPLVGKGGKIAVIFRKPGEYRYYCHVHPFMQGLVVVG
jgi:plastocyanin